MIPIAGTIILLIALFAFRPSLAGDKAGRALLFLALFILPILATGLGGAAHVENSTSTRFCLSCHVMEPYGRSLRIADPEAVPASHVQNRRVPRDHACFSCHTTYTMYGDLKAKMRGLRHVWVYYSGSIPEKISLYEPYDNRECLHCHAGARSYEENELHEDREASCLDCHSTGHEIDKLDELELRAETAP